MLLDWQCKLILFLWNISLIEGNRYLSSPKLPDSLWCPGFLLFCGFPGISSGDKSGLYVRLTSQVYLVQSLLMSGSVHLLHLRLRDVDKETFALLSLNVRSTSVGETTSVYEYNSRQI